MQVIATSSVNFFQVAVSASKWAVGTDARDAAAMLITGCFWLWFEESVFSAAAPPGGWSKANLGTRPSVIMRGEPSPPGSVV